MPNREDVRKMIVAYQQILTNISEDPDGKKDFTMREIQELVLAEVIKKEEEEKEQRKR